MALSLRITNENGIVTEYHRIKSLEITDRIKIVLASYISKEYRDKEKQVKINRKTSEELNLRLIEERLKETPDIDLINELTEQINSLDITDKNYEISTFNYTISFDNEDSISFASIYNIIKQELTFENAEDC